MALAAQTAADCQNAFTVRKALHKLSYLADERQKETVVHNCALGLNVERAYCCQSDILYHDGSSTAMSGRSCNVQLNFHLEVSSRV
jgi:hypothetical protein